MNYRIKFEFTEKEYSALLEIALREKRGIANQAAYIVAKELERVGLLKIDDKDKPQESK